MCIRDRAADDSDVQTAARQLHGITATGSSVPLKGHGVPCSHSSGEGRARARNPGQGSVAGGSSGAVGSSLREPCEQHRRLLAAAAFCSGSDSVERCGMHACGDSQGGRRACSLSPAEGGPASVVQLCTGIGHAEHSSEKAPPWKRVCTSSE